MLHLNVMMMNQFIWRRPPNIDTIPKIQKILNTGSLRIPDLVIQIVVIPISIWNLLQGTIDIQNLKFVNKTLQLNGILQRYQIKTIQIKINTHFVISI